MFGERIDSDCALCCVQLREVVLFQVVWFVRLQSLEVTKLSRMVALCETGCNQTSAPGFERVDCPKLSLAKAVDRWKRSCLLRTRSGFAALTRGPVAATALLLRPLGRWGWTEHPPATRCAAGAARGGGGTGCAGSGPDAGCEGGQRKLIVVVS